VEDFRIMIVRQAQVNSKIKGRTSKLMMLASMKAWKRIRMIMRIVRTKVYSWVIFALLRPRAILLEVLVTWKLEN
jgi:hypothetical protein